MAHHVWTILCGKTLTDANTRVVSFIDVTERLILQGVDETVEESFERVRREGGKGVRFPVQLQLVSWWVRSDYSRPESTDLRISLLGSGGEHSFEQEVVIDLEENTTSRRLTLNFSELPISSLGRSWFVVEQATSRKGARSWATVAKIPLEIEAGT